MNILVIGQTSLHWGRMEFGNIGNFYVMDPFFKELKRVFPKAQIKTTIQMSEGFSTENGIIVIPLDLYYSWDDPDYLTKCFSEYGKALLYNKTGAMDNPSAFTKEVMDSDLVIDMSGDVWGDNADFTGENRFLIGLLKDRVAQLLKKKVVMIAGSPGPFENHWNLLPFIKEVFEGFNFVTNRERLSVEILHGYGINTDKVRSYACPAFLFEGTPDSEIEEIIQKEKIVIPGKATVGVIICGWNMSEGPYSKWPRADSEYNVFAEMVEFLVNELDLRVVLLSHNNGFERTPDFKLVHGRDFPIAKQLFENVICRGKVTPENIHLVEEVYTPKQMKTLISHFDMLISGRVHGSVAGLSQNVPTVLIDYGHEPKAHKIRGFAQLLQVEEYLADPGNINDIKSKVSNCYDNSNAYRDHLKAIIPTIQGLSRQNFEDLRIFEEQLDKEGVRQK